jgi:two-component system response regulator BaeR
MKETLLIVEDETDLAKLIADYAKASDFDAVICGNGAEALTLLREKKFNMVILDLMLPGLDGLSLCREFRQFSDTPIIMVTAKVEEIDRLLGLEIGADDYLCKPFSPRELMARCKTILKRSRKGTSSPLHDSESTAFQIKVAAQQIVFRRQILELTRSEYLILSYLIAHPGRVFSRAQLLDIAGEDKLDVTERAVDSHIKNLRKKILAIDEHAQVIHSIYGLGYRFDDGE